MNFIEIINSSKNLSDVSRKIYGSSDTKHRELIKKMFIDNDIDYKQWILEKKKKCLHCGKILKSNQKKFCSSNCSATYNNFLRKKKFYCLFCGKELKSKQKKYCNKNCQYEYEYKTYIEKWKQGLVDGIVGNDGLSFHIRRYLFEKNNNKCENCNWGEVNIYTGNVPLQVHHIDGNAINNDENNLQLLCPNCHSLTNNYGNIGSHKSKRCYKQIYFKQNKKIDITKSYCLSCGKELNDKQFSFCSLKCSHKYQKINLSKEEIIDAFMKNEKKTFDNISKYLGVSSTFLRKKIKEFDIINFIQNIKKN